MKNDVITAGLWWVHFCTGPYITEAVNILTGGVRVSLEKERQV